MFYIDLAISNEKINCWLLSPGCNGDSGNNRNWKQITLGSKFGNHYASSPSQKSTLMVVAAGRRCPKLQLKWCLELLLFCFRIRERKRVILSIIFHPECRLTDIKRYWTIAPRLLGNAYLHTRMIWWIQNWKRIQTV